MEIKKLIRKGVFETNSSSCHSLSIDNNDYVLDTLYPDEEGNIILEGGAFGWDWFKHNDAITKANYASVALKDNPEILIKVIKEQTGCNDVIIHAYDDYNSSYYSYIDHYSYDVCPTNEEDLKNFIFNKNSWLFGGNDNETASPDFYIVPKYTKNGIIKPEFQYELFFKDKNITKTYKFLEYPTDENFDDLINSLNPKYNKSKNILEIDSHYWSGSEVYFENNYWYKQDIKKGYVVLSNTNFIKEQVNLKDLSWDDKSKAVTEYINNNLDNKDIVYKLVFEIKKL